MKWIVTGPSEVSTFTFWVNLPPGFSPLNQASPVLLLLPSVLQPGLPAFDGLIVTGECGPFTPSHFAIIPQEPPGKHFLRSLFVFGRSEGSIIANVCGPIFFGFDLLMIVSSSPLVIVSGATNLSGS